MLYLLYTVHVIVCLFLIMVVLLQQGKGADLSVFGGGGTQTAFGARGAATLLHKLTVFSFVAFILTTVGIGFLKSGGGGGSVMTELEEPAGDEAAAVDDAMVPAEGSSGAAAAGEGLETRSDSAAEITAPPAEESVDDDGSPPGQG